MDNICIGLFGTCDNIPWRHSFIEKYNLNNINYFNPMVDNWSPELAEIEAQHLISDQIILFPVLSQSFGFGSLSEVGFGILNAIQLNKHASFVILIDDSVNEYLEEKDPVRAKDSKRARSLVMAHLEKINLPNVYIVNDLPEMFAISIELYNVHKKLHSINLRYKK